MICAHIHFCEICTFLWDLHASRRSSTVSLQYPQNPNPLLNNNILLNILASRKDMTPQTRSVFYVCFQNHLHFKKNICFSDFTTAPSFVVLNSIKSLFPSRLNFVQQCRRLKCIYSAFKNQSSSCPFCTCKWIQIEEKQELRYKYRNSKVKKER